MRDERSMSSIFDGAEAAGYGCVLFDLVDQGDGKMAPEPGPGWASVNGLPATRIASVNDLDSDVKWLTNLDRAMFWKSGFVRMRKLRESSYFKTDLGQIMRELGLMPKKITSAKACELTSEIFARTMRWGVRHYGIKELGEQEWIDEVRGAIAEQDVPLGMEIDEALSRAFIDFVPCVVRKEEGQRLITLRRPRVSHAKNVLGTAIPGGGWKFLGEADMPAQEERAAWLWKKQKPCLVKIAIRGFQEGCPSHVPGLLQLGEAIGQGGRRKERNWMTLQEARYFGRYAKVEIQAAFEAERWELFEGDSQPLDQGELSDLSISLGLLGEAHWMAVAGRSRHPVTRSKSMVSPRACWLRASDRFYCFAASLPIAAAGFQVLSYGGGAVSVLATPARLGELWELASECGLMGPAVLFDALGRGRK